MQVDSSPKKHPCRKGPNGQPCRNVRVGEAYTLDQCRICWNVEHRAKWHLYAGGDGKVTPAPQVPAEPAPTTPKTLLLGDAIEQILAKFRWVRVLKKWIEKWFGNCGCPERKCKLNKLHELALRVRDEQLGARQALAELVALLRTKQCLLRSAPISSDTPKHESAS